MKLKAVFFLFNGVLVASFLIILLMPLILLGPSSFSLFWGRNWIIAGAFVLTLAAVNAYFILNWKLFSSLEREDWPALVVYLEQRILQKGSTRRMHVRMLLNAYLITSNTESIRALEAFIREKKPSLIGAFSIPFGIPYLLMKDAAVSEAFFASLLSTPGCADRDWIRWNRSFSLVQLGRTEARDELSALTAESREPAVRLLSLYLLDVLARNDGEAAQKVEEARAAMLKEHSPQHLGRLIEKAGDNMELVILSKIVRDALSWYSRGPQETPPGAEAPLPEAAQPGPTDGLAH